MNLDSLVETIRALSDEDRKVLTEKLNAAAKPKSANVNDVDAVLRNVPGMSQYTRSAIVDVLARSGVVSGDIDRVSAAAQGVVTFGKLNAMTDNRPLCRQLLATLDREFDFRPDPSKPIDVAALNAALNVNRRWIGTPDRRPKGTPLFCVSND
jgi:hypothetical protein